MIPLRKASPHRVSIKHSGFAAAQQRRSIKCASSCLPTLAVTGLRSATGRAIPGGWELNGLNLPPSGLLRVSGRTTGGITNASSGLVQTVASYPASPQIVVQQPAGSTIPNGATRHFGMVPAGRHRSVNFTIRNIGNADLTGLSDTIDGADATDFEVIGQPDLSGARSGWPHAIHRSLRPATAGSKTAMLHIASNDADENPFDIVLTGRRALRAATGRGPSTWESSTLRWLHRRLTSMAMEWTIGRSSPLDCHRCRRICAA